MLAVDIAVLLAFAFHPIRKLILFSKSPDSRPKKAEVIGICLAVAASTTYVIVLMSHSHFY